MQKRPSVGAHLAIVTALFLTGCTSSNPTSESSGPPPRSVSGSETSNPSESPASPRPLSSGALAFISSARHRRVLVLFSGRSRPSVVVGPDQADAGISASSEGQVAYAVGLGEGTGEIRIRNLNGSPVAYTVPPVGDDQYPAWSPGGDKIAFMDGHSLEVFDTRTRSVVKVTTPPGPCSDTHPTWWPGGTKIGFFRDCGVGSKAGIYEINADGTRPKRILLASRYTSHKPWPGTSISGSPIGLSWSPDGASMAMEMFDGSLWLVPAKLPVLHTGDELSMLAGPDPAEATGAGAGTVAWSPTGQLAFVRGGAVVVFDFRNRHVSPVAGTVGLQPTAISWAQLFNASAIRPARGLDHRVLRTNSARLRTDDPPR